MCLQLPTPPIDEIANQTELAISQALLRDNINKIEGTNSSFVKPAVELIVKLLGNQHKDKLFYNLISAAQRKVRRKPGKSASSHDSKEPTTPNGIKEFDDEINSCDAKDVS